MNSIKWMLLVALAVVVGACGPFAGPSGPPGFSGTTIKIVSSYPLTGGDSADGVSMANSAKQALQDHGAKSGNYTLVYQSFDDASAAKGAWDGDIETSNANKAVADPSVLLYLGTYNSGAVKLSIPILNQAGPLLALSGANTYPGLTHAVAGITTADEPGKYYPNGVRNYARIVPPDDIQGVVDAAWAKELGATSAYVLHDQQAYGKGIADVFAAAAPKFGIKIIAEEGIDTKATDYSAQATKVASSAADIFFFGGVESSHGSLLWKAVKSAGFKGKLLAPDGEYTPNFPKAAGADAEGTYVTYAGLPVDELLKVPEAKKWHDEYVQMFGGEPTGYGSYGYEAALVGLKAIDACVAKNDVSRKCVRDQVFALKDFKGIFGYSYSINENGDTTASGMSRNLVQNGAFKFLGMAPAPGQ
jgi:branched-chain amino acid transport system substrate-binding protein